ncbi:hypothetical protein D3C79_974020 [compost metagenome]
MPYLAGFPILHGNVGEQRQAAGRITVMGRDLLLCDQPVTVLAVAAAQGAVQVVRDFPAIDVFGIGGAVVGSDPVLTRQLVDGGLPYQLHRQDHALAAAEIELETITRLQQRRVVLEHADLGEQLRR